MRPRGLTRIIAAAGLAVAALLVLRLSMGGLPGTADLVALRDTLAAAWASDPWRAAALYVTIYVAVAGLSLPGATVLSLAGGAIFGLGVGVVLVSVASTAGACLSFLAARWVLRDAVQRRFGERLRAVNAGIAREGAFYLFALRLVPVLPFFAINVAMGLTPIGLWRFAWVSQLGMLPATIAFVNAGTRLAQVEAPGDVLSPALVASFAALGLLPLVARRAVGGLRRRRAYRGWTRPRRFDRNLVVIGAGSAGLVAAYVAAALKARVTLVERDRMGGDCLHTGCVPSKALIRSARARAEVARAGEYGIRTGSAEVDFAAVMARVRRVIADVAPHDSPERYEGLGVECVSGAATLTSPWEVTVRTEAGVRRLTTRAVVLATGARPTVPPIPGLADAPHVTSDTIWSLEARPDRLVVLGGGPVGCELAQAFARLGSRVTLVEQRPRLLAREDPDASEAVAASFRAEGVDVRAGHAALRCEAGPAGHALVVARDGVESRVAFDLLLCAVGRTPTVAGLGLETLGIPTTPAGTIETDASLATRYPNIYACGDVAGPYQFTHAAAHQAWYAAVNALFGGFRRLRVDDRVVPWTTFTDPEVARVGLSETEARARGLDVEVTRYALADLDRAIADGATEGFVKVLTPRGRDRILGVTIVGARAGDLIAEFVLAMRHGLGLNRILGTVHVYPTFAEAARHAAGAWRRAHVPARALAWAERFHAWRRG